MTNLYSSEFEAIIKELGESKPICVMLSASETLTAMTMIKLASILKPDLDMRRLWEKFNENHTLKELRDLNYITINLSAAEAFTLITAIQLVLYKDSHVGIMAVLAREAGQKIQNQLDPNSSLFKHVSKAWVN